MLGELLKKKREAKGYTQKQIVSMSGLTLSSVSRVENGTVSDIDIYIEYARSIEYALNIADLKITIEPNNKLTGAVLKNKSISTFIYELMDGDFFNTPRSVVDIKERLVQMKKIEESTPTVKVSGALYHIVRRKLLKKKKIVGSKNNTYFKS